MSNDGLTTFPLGVITGLLGLAPRGTTVPLGVTAGLEPLLIGGIADPVLFAGGRIGTIFGVEPVLSFDDDP